jgi:peptidoglycan hydrolase-like protein with peptidoglycan-binding domain
MATPSKTITETQTWLKQLGYNPGIVDGIWGNNSEKAYQSLLANNIVNGDVVMIPWGVKFTEQETAKLRQVIRNLGLPVHMLQDFMACIAWETGEKFSPSVKNPGSSATGLIQFMDATAKSMGTTTDALAKMTVVEQLGYVYMTILKPVAVGQPDSYVMWTKEQSQYLPNKGIDFNEDGVITRLEAVQKVRNKLVKGFLPGNVRKAA